MDLMYLNYAFGDEIRLVMREGARLMWHPRVDYSGGGGPASRLARGNHNNNKRV